MGGWFSSDRSRPLYISPGIPPASKRIMDRILMDKIRIPHYLHRRLFDILKFEDTMQRENYKRSKKTPDTNSAKARAKSPQQKINNAKAFCTGTLSQKNRIRRNIHSMTQKNKDTNSAKARDKSLQQKINKVKASCT